MLFPPSTTLTNLSLLSWRPHFTAMRHRHGFKKLGTDHVHRKAILKNMAIALIKHERITTTLTKAKQMRKTGDKMITLAKRDTEGSRKTAWTWMRHPALMEKLFGPLKERFMARPGGYTRILKIPNRKGDNAPMAIVELVDNRFPPLRESWAAPSQSAAFSKGMRPLLEDPAPPTLSEDFTRNFEKLSLAASEAVDQPDLVDSTERLQPGQADGKRMEGTPV